MNRYQSTREREIRNLLATDQLTVKTRASLLRELKAIEVEQRKKKKEREAAIRRGDVVDRRRKLPANAQPVEVPPTAPRPKLKPGEFSWFTFERATREQIATALAANEAHKFLFPDAGEVWDADAAAFQAAGCPIPGDRAGAIRKNEVRGELEPGFNLVWDCTIGYTEAQAIQARGAKTGFGAEYRAALGTLKTNYAAKLAAFISHFEATYIDKRAK